MVVKKPKTGGMTYNIHLFNGEEGRKRTVLKNLRGIRRKMRC